MQPRGKRERAAALELLDYVRTRKQHIMQPATWRTHVVALLVHKRGADAHKIVDTLLAVPSRDQNSPDLLRLAAELASKFRIDLFEALYHAVAIDKDVELVTANADYVRRAGSLGHIRLLSDWVACTRIAESDKNYSDRRRRRTPDDGQKKR
jgi:predicted nucleic acid-binding protein